LLTNYADSSATEISENKAKSPAAYLLFYRRRSEKPLGPQYLQELVSAACNPDLVESAADDVGESGEVRLGGPTRLLHGSPSDSAAEVATTSSATLLNNAAGGLGGAAVNNLIRRPPMERSTSEEDEGVAMGGLGLSNGRTVYGPERPPHLQQYGSQGNDWSFDLLEGGGDGAAESDALLHNADGDADSTIAEFDRDEAVDLEQDDEFGVRGYMDPSNNGLTLSASSTGAAGMNTPVEEMSVDDQHDQHGLYSSAHVDPMMYELEDTGDSLHLEDAGMTGQEDEARSVVEIHLPPGGDEPQDEAQGRQD
jgi:ubiquitin carboxyl-terminal hydrolase 4/11